MPVLDATSSLVSSSPTEIVPEKKVLKNSQPVLSAVSNGFQRKPFKVLILDDSPTVLNLLDKMISSEKKLSVVSKIDDSINLESEIESTSQT